MIVGLIVVGLVLALMLAAFLWGLLRAEASFNHFGRMWPILILWDIYAILGLALRDYLIERRKRSR